MKMVKASLICFELHKWPHETSCPVRTLFCPFGSSTIRIVSILSVLCLFLTLYSVQYVIVEFSIKMLNRKGDKMRTLGEGEHTRVSSSIIYNYL